jgi:hypothetical protein
MRAVDKSYGLFEVAIRVISHRVVAASYESPMVALCSSMSIARHKEAANMKRALRGKSSREGYLYLLLYSIIYVTESLLQTLRAVRVISRKP